MFIGARMGQVFALAKELIEMPPEEIEKLLPRKVEASAAFIHPIAWKGFLRSPTSALRSSPKLGSRGVPPSSW